MENPALAKEMMADAESAFGEFDRALRLYAESADLGNERALKKAADLCYGLGRFGEAEEKYAALYVTGKFPEVAPKLCLFACEREDLEAAGGFFSEMDRTDPSNVEVIAAYYLATGNPF